MNDWFARAHLVSCVLGQQVTSGSYCKLCSKMTVFSESWGLGVHLVDDRLHPSLDGFQRVSSIGKAIDNLGLPFDSSICNP